jgi:hypothetical protein
VSFIDVLPAGADAGDVEAAGAGAGVGAAGVGFGPHAASTTAVNKRERILIQFYNVGSPPRFITIA